MKFNLIGLIGGVVGFSSLALGDSSFFRLPPRTFESSSYLSSSIIVITEPEIDRFTPIANSSDLNGVCQYFGHVSFAGDVKMHLNSHNEKGEEMPYWRRVGTIDNQGRLTGVDWANGAVASITCNTDGYLRGGSYTKVKYDMTGIASIENPRLADFKGVPSRIAVTSDLLGVCRLFGFGSAVSGVAEDDAASAVIVNENARVAATSKQEPNLAKVFCQDNIGAYYPRTNEFYDQGNGMTMAYAPRTEQGDVINVKHSDPHGVCKLLGYGSYVEGTDARAPGGNARRAVVDFSGRVVGFKDVGFVFASLTCSAGPIDQSKDNIVAKQPDGSSLVRRPRYVAEPYNSEISDASDPGEVCRYFHFNDVVPGTVKTQMGGLNVPQVIITANGQISPRVPSIGNVLGQLTCR